MASVVQKLYGKRLITKPPKFVPANTQYEVIMGSIAYGVSNDTSDMDIYGFCIPPRDYVFPHLRGEILGFSEPGPQFDQYQEHHIYDKDAEGGKGREYDITMYSIIKYFRLCMENNPNMIDSLFVPRRCILYTTPVGELVRENRKLFLHKGAWHKFKGYAYSQIHKMNTKNPVGKRKKIIEEFGYDVKFAYHVVRLLNEVEQILTECDLDLERNREQLKAIRRGDWSQQKIGEYFEQKESELESVYTKSDLPPLPDAETLQNLLLQCLETHYGSLDGAIAEQNDLEKAVRDIDNILEKVRNKL
ncbi:MAG: DNA polymerase beta superfamily protein [Thiohalomonadales bacterium]